jgi:hypothetical protein
MQKSTWTVPLRTTGKEERATILKEAGRAELRIISQGIPLVIIEISE